MEDADEVGEQEVGTEGGLFVELGALDIAGIGAARAQGMELAVAGVLSQQLTGGEVVATAVAQQPEVGIGGTLQHGLEGQGNRAAVSVVGPEVTACSVANHLADGAAPAGDVPSAAGDLVDHHGGARLGLMGHGGEGVIAAVDEVEQAVGPALAAVEQPVEPEPFGARQGGRLHVLGTLDQRNADVLKLSVAAGVLAGRRGAGR